MQPGQDRGGAPVGGGPATMYQRSGGVLLMLNLLCVDTQLQI